MNIIVLGGGIAGVSTAIALRQKGFDVTIYERHNTEASIGAGIVLWPNAVYVLKQLGLFDQVKLLSGCPVKMQRLTNLGEKLGSIDIEFINETMGYPSFSILRTDFQSVLIAKLRELSITVNYGYNVARIQNTSNKTEVLFQNGSSISSDIVIGADGRMASQARKYVFGENKAIYQGFINWVGVMEFETDSFREIVVHDYWGLGARFGIVPISATMAYWAGGVVSEKIAGNDATYYKNELQSIFSGWPELVNTVIAETPLNRINKIYVHDHNPIKTWHKNNVVVIGDAAHAPLPTSGQGACQALEDAWHLANCIASNGTDINNAFTQFTQLRSAKTANIIAAGRGLASSIFNTNPEYCKERNLASKKTDYTRVAAGMAQAWSEGLMAVSTA
ncbi:2-polyprenyl-6-methoxyphenol hydroxylase-like FAD-dependent oxidoreductase [Alteromonadaceae bacterium 2753L.S.0a.02]|nr:2-polyprenyl-6-methoxyphenol hydroxylase-like FAD-dependent oxidoreductase [Alteromonadaceae bacterium 2753L.S.0a.02]